MTTEPTDGGPTFPTLHIPGQSPPGWSGISIRDYFAAAAMFSCIQKEGIKISAAKEAYWIADAMLAARKGGAA